MLIIELGWHSFRFFPAVLQVLKSAVEKAVAELSKTPLDPIELGRACDTLKAMCSNGVHLKACRNQLHQMQTKP